jgi:hypothetical protein
LQVKATKRLSYGLDFTSGFTWQKELMMGSEAIGTGPGTTVVTAINDVFNRPMNKYLSMFSRPFSIFIAANYRTPKLNINKVVSLALRDWQVGTVLQYASGMPIIVPTAQNQLSTLLFRSTFANRVPGQPLFLKDLNCHCVDPTKELVLNPNAWVDPPAGQFGMSAAYYNDYRYQRRPSEAMSLGRAFRIKEHASLSIRADFNNIFNRTQMSNPTSGGTTTAPTNAKATPSYDKNGKPTSGFGYINTGAVYAQPRNGIIVARIQF